MILARGGSKGIPNKNLKHLDGISLLAHTITVLNTSNLFHHIWVSTDSDSIAEEATKCNLRMIENKIPQNNLFITYYPLNN